MVTGGQPPQGLDLPPDLSAQSLDDYYVPCANCAPVCGNYQNLYYGDPGVAWIPERGDGQTDGLRVDLYYSSSDGRVPLGDAPATLVIYPHSAGSSKEALLGTHQSLLNQLLQLGNAGKGVLIASLDFRHPHKQMNADGTPSSTRDLSHATQFFRHHAQIFNIDPDDIFMVGSSLGGGVIVQAAVTEIASPSDPHPVRRMSSAIRGAFVRDGQSSFSPAWVRSNFLEPDLADRYQRSLLEDEQRLIYGHAPALVGPDSPYMELVYSANRGHQSIAVGCP